MSLTRERLLAEMGIAPLWVRRDAAPAEAETAMPVTVEAEASTALPLAAADEGSRVSAPEPAPSLDAPVRATGDAPMDSLMTLAWPQLREAIVSCRACPLCERRKQAVPGVGDMDAEWLFIGEGPGAEEDERGEPFVGQAGRLLDAMLGAIDLRRGDNVYIANAVKCRPPGNRTPEAGELAACRPYLARQIALIRPRLIVLLGRVAVQSVLGQDASLASLRGKTLRYQDRDCGLDIPVLVTYHPAYLLRNLPDKAKAWEDLCRARGLMSSLCAEGNS